MNKTALRFLLSFLLILITTSSLLAIDIYTANETFNRLAYSIPTRPVEWVNPFIGTKGDHGQLYPGAVSPFGLVKLSPDTSKVSHAGYYYENRKLLGFSHLRVGGVGCNGAGGGLLILPGYGKVKNKFRFDKHSEDASPGYYAVGFKNGVDVKLTATKSVGFHDYKFPSDAKDIYVLLKSDYSYAGGGEGELTKIDTRNLEGFMQGKNVGGHGYYKLFYHLTFNQPFDSIQKIEIKGDSYYIARFSELSGSELKIKVGLSPINSEYAMEEIEHQAPGW